MGLRFLTGRFCCVVVRSILIPAPFQSWLPALRRFEVVAARPGRPTHIHSRFAGPSPARQWAEPRRRVLRTRCQLPSWPLLPRRTGYCQDFRCPLASARRVRFRAVLLAARRTVVSLNHEYILLARMQYVKEKGKNTWTHLLYTRFATTFEADERFGRFASFLAGCLDLGSWSVISWPPKWMNANIICRVGRRD